MKDLTVVDLDGTYVRCNTLHVYIRCGLRRMWARKRLWCLFKSFVLLALRKAKMIRHTTMKFGVCEMIDNEDQEFRRIFVGEVRSNINRILAERLADDHSQILLATAALDVYVPWIWQGDYVATKTAGNKERIECRGAEKLRQVEKYALNNDLTLKRFYTDNLDDLPLIKKSPEPVLVNADRSTIARLRDMGIRFEEI